MNKKDYKYKVAKKLTKENLGYDWFLLVVVFVLTLFGISFLGSAMLGEGGDYFRDNFFKQLFIGIIFGAAVGSMFMITDYHWFFKNKRLIAILVFASLFIIFLPNLLALIESLFTSQSSSVAKAAWAERLPFVHFANNAIRWIDLGFTKVQPSEFAKIGLLLYLAGNVNQISNFTWDNYKTIIWLIAVCLFMILLQPDLGSVVVIASILLSVLWVSNIELKKILGILGIVVIAGIMAISAYSYRSDRVAAWGYLNFCKDSYSINSIPERSERQGICKILPLENLNESDLYQTEKVREAVVAGGWFGQGYRGGEIKTTIPEVTTDGVVAVIAEEGGAFSVFVMIFLFFLIFWRGIDIASKAPDVGGKAVAVGISVWILIQALWNITGMTGLFPMKGLPLPFVSEGNSAYLSLFIAIGILLNISSQRIEESESKVR